MFPPSHDQLLLRASHLLCWVRHHATGHQATTQRRRIERASAGDVHPASAGLRSTPGGDDLVDRVEHVRAERHVGRGEQVVELVVRARSDEGGRHGRMLDRPRQRELRHREPGLGGDQPEALRRVELRVVVTVEVVGVGRRPRSGGRAVTTAGTCRSATRPTAGSTRARRCRGGGTSAARRARCLGT